LISVALANTRFDNLASYERNSSSKLDDIAFIAVIKLVSLAPTGELSLRTLCENIALGKSVDQSFTEAFGISKKEFYRQFVDYQKSYNTPTPTAIPAGMVAIKGKVVLANPSQKYSDYIVSFCNSKIVQCLPGNLISNDGSFDTYLDPGDYKISVNPLNGGDTIGWYIKSGLVPDPSCAEFFQVGNEQEIKLVVDFQPTPCPTPSAVSAGTVAINGKVVLANPSQKYSDYIVSFCNSKIVQCLPGNLISDDGSFDTYLDPGDYKISVNPLNGGDTIGWYVKNGLVPDPSCAEFFQVGDEKEINIVVDFQTTPCPTPTLPPADLSTPEISVITTGRVILKDATQKFSDFVIVFCNTEVSICLPGVPIKPNGTFSTMLVTGKYRISMNSTTNGENLGWYTKEGLVADATCAKVITVDVKHEIDITIDLHEKSC